MRGMVQVENKKKIREQFESRLSELERLGRVLEGFWDSHGLPLKALMDVNLALDEIFTNIVSYGFTDGGRHFVGVSLELEGEGLSITVEDDGVPFNPLEAPDPDLNVPLEERKTGGLGIYFVRKMMEDLEYARKSGKNVLKMKKRLS